METELIRVYISGPISQGSKASNLAAFCDAQVAILRAGMSPFNPGLSMLLENVADITHDTWLKADLAWVKMADVVLRLPGQSKGADEETAFAHANNIEVIGGWGYGPGTAADQLLGWHESKALDVQNGQPGEQIQQRAAIPKAPEDNPQVTCSVEAGCCDAIPPIDPQGDHLAALRNDRGKIYGPPIENHEGIALMWAVLLKPWAESHIGLHKPLPVHVIALMMAAMKLDRMRLVFAEDNYDDMENYLYFAKQWQRTFDQGGDQ